MAASVRQRRLSPVELVEAHLRQIEKQNPRLNAFVMILADQARQAAKKAEAKPTGGPLDGVPVTLKDSFNIAGLPTRIGSRFYPPDPAPGDAVVTERLKRAGAILLGKTNTPEFLMAYETDNYVTGRTNNPWDLERTPGGSSGGEAAAIASFCSAGGAGSDGGGSIRVPAHFCGIAGLKPTPGRIPATGHVPPIEYPTGVVSVAGPMARSVRDLRLLFEVLAGYDYRDPFAAPVPLRPSELAGLRIGVMEQFGDVPAQPSIRQAVRDAASKLRDLGFTVDEFRPRGIERAPNLWGFLFGDLPAPFFKDRMGARESEAHWTAAETLLKALERPAPTARQVVEAFVERDRLRALLLEQMERFPVLLAPVSSIPAFRHRERRWETDVKPIGLFQAMMTATTFNVLGLPGLTVPFGLTAENLPVGVQLVARPWEEELLLDLGTRLEEARGPFPAPPQCLS